jgi:hypothetical protein
MKTFSIISLVSVVIQFSCLAGTTLVFDPANNRNDFTGLVGFRFSSTNPSTEINYLGFVDDGADGLNAAHSVGLYLWDGSGYALQRSATVSAGSDAPLHNGYRWASIPSITLAETGVTYWLVVAAVASGDGDSWGDSFASPLAPPFDPANAGKVDSLIGDLNFAPGDAGYYDAGATDLSNPYLAFDTTTGFYSFYNAGNLATAIPEPSTTLLLGAVALVCFHHRRR